MFANQNTVQSPRPEFKDDLRGIHCVEAKLAQGIVAVFFLPLGVLFRASTTCLLACGGQDMAGGTGGDL